MLTTRSTRLAACLLLLLLFGWIVRSGRKGGVSSQPPQKPGAPTALEEEPKMSFPEE